MTSKRIIRLVIGIAFIPAMGWLVPASLWGQSATVPGATLVATITPEDLEFKVGDMASNPSRFGEAGDLLEKTGRLLAVEDPAGVDLLIRAARLQYFAGAFGKAQGSMKEAGWRAMGQGQVQKAANAYADAALIAVAQQDKETAAQLVKIVKLLAQWPGVTPSEAKQISKRIG